MNLSFKPSQIAITAMLPVLAAVMLSCSSSEVNETGTGNGSCAEPGDTLRLGYYAFFEPVSYVNPDETPFKHYGFESDLVSALEAIEGANLSFERNPIEAWEGIWLKSSDEFDVVGGGITILESRTMDESGTESVQFTNGHIAFRQSLLTRTEDADRLTSYDSLTSDVRIGALAGTTGEARLLQLVGLADADGVLISGTRVQTPIGEWVAGGTSEAHITAAEWSPQFEGRTMLIPPSAEFPTVVYVGDNTGEVDLLNALRTGEVDGVARGEIGNSDAASVSDGRFAVSILDSESEWGGFTVSASNDELASCLNEHIDYLTDNRNIGYAQWLEDPDVFLKRAGSR